MAKEAPHAPARHEASVRARADLARARRRYSVTKNWSWSGRQTVVVRDDGFAQSRGRRGSSVTAMSVAREHAARWEGAANKAARGEQGRPRRPRGVCRSRRRAEGFVSSRRPRPRTRLKTRVIGHLLRPPGVFGWVEKMQKAARGWFAGKARARGPRAGLRGGSLPGGESSPCRVCSLGSLGSVWCGGGIKAASALHLWAARVQRQTLIWFSFHQTRERLTNQYSVCQCSPVGALEELCRSGGEVKKFAAVRIPPLVLYTVVSCHAGRAPRGDSEVCWLGSLPDSTSWHVPLGCVVSERK